VSSGCRVRPLDEGIGVKTTLRSKPSSGGCQGIIDTLSTPVFSVDRELRYTAFNAAHATAMRDADGAEIELGGKLIDAASFG